MVSLSLDFVLVWEIRSRRKRRGKGKVSGEEGEAVPTEENSRSERRKAQLAQWREKFVQNLESAGLLMEKVLQISVKSIDFINKFELLYLFINNVSMLPVLSLQEETANEKKTIHFLKLSAPWDVLVCYAEELCVRAPLQVSAALIMSNVRFHPIFL